MIPKRSQKYWIYRNVKWPLSINKLLVQDDRTSLFPTSHCCFKNVFNDWSYWIIKCKLAQKLHGGRTHPPPPPNNFWCAWHWSISHCLALLGWDHMEGINYTGLFWASYDWGEAQSPPPEMPRSEPSWAWDFPNLECVGAKHPSRGGCGDFFVISAWKSSISLRDPEAWETGWWAWERALRCDSDCHARCVRLGRSAPPPPSDLNPKGAITANIGMQLINCVKRKTTVSSFSRYFISYNLWNYITMHKLFFFQASRSVFFGAVSFKKPSYH